MASAAARVALLLFAGAALAGGPRALRAEEKPPEVPKDVPKGGPNDGRKDADAPSKPDRTDPRTLTDEEKAKKLAEIEKAYEDNRRNQDLVQVRTRRTGAQYAGDMRYAPAAKFLKKVFDDDRDLTTQVAALVAIGKSGDVETIQYAVGRAIADASKRPVFVASLPRMFAQVESAEAKEWLPTKMAHRDPMVAACLVEAVGESRNPTAVAELVALYGKTRDEGVRFEALRAIGKCGGKAAVSRLLPYLVDEDWRMRMAALEGLGHTGEPLAIPEVRKLVARDQEPIVVETAVEALVRLGTKDAIEPLVDSLRIGRLRARQKARAGLRGLAKSLYGHDKDYQVDPNSWRSWWVKVKSGLAPDDPTFSQKETASYFNFPIESDRVLFILDVSGSMQWPDAPRDSGIRPADWKERRIDLAHKEIFKALRELAAQNQGRLPKKKGGDTGDVPVAPTDEGVEPPTLFNVATFSGAVMSWQKEPAFASKENVEAAIQWIEKQLPRGGTATYDALEFGLSQPNVDTIYFLSDGVPSAGRYEERETILAHVRRLNRFQRVSINTVALIVGLSPIESARKYEDPDDMADLMSRIASENQGRFSNQSKP